MSPRPRTMRFGPLDVDYDDRVLTPRAWTLAQSQWAAELAAGAAPGAIAELCAGAGHIGLAAAVLADRNLVQVEADPVAADYARRNAARAGWAARTEVRTDRVQTALRPDERFVLIVADPPYLPSATVAQFPQDPVVAIDGGADGLDLARACLDVAAAHLRDGGHLLLQVAGPDQADQVEELVATTGRLVAGQRRVIDNRRAVVQLSVPQRI